MRIMFIGGTHPRHLYYFNAVANEFPVEAAIYETRSGMLPDPPEGITQRDKELWHRHFGNRLDAERSAFGLNIRPKIPGLKVQADELNTAMCANLIRKVNPDLVLIFGCHMIKEPLLSALPKNSINLHLGLSPRYRGSATLFWPFYFLEPNHAGCTFHRIVPEPDAGDILHQCRPPLVWDDTIHQVSARAVVTATNHMLALLRKYPDWKFHQQKNTGKCFLTTDFIPQHLRTIYEAFDDNLVNEYLDGNLDVSEPWLYQGNYDV